MEEYKREFIEFMVHSKVLSFGDFVTKSGRKTPFFINTGNYKTGEQIKKLGEYYAHALNDSIGSNYTVLFGPAYKGIPLVVTTSIALETKFGKNVSFCFNRKESKDHGEKGTLVGCIPSEKDRIVIIEDVTTAGTSIRETVPLLKQFGPIILSGLLVSVDRMERSGKDHSLSALQEIGKKYEMPTGAIVSMNEVVTYLSQKEINGKVLITGAIRKKIDAYYTQYGVNV